MKKLPKLTDWFSGDVKPAMKGFYQREYGGSGLLDYWSGKKWLYDCQKGSVALNQNRRWRGLSEAPKKGA